MDEILDEYLRTPTPVTPSPLVSSDSTLFIAETTTRSVDTPSTVVTAPIVISQAQLRLITPMPMGQNNSTAFELEHFLDCYKTEVGDPGFEAFVAGNIRMELAKMNLLKKRNERKKSWSNLALYVKKLME